MEMTTSVVCEAGGMDVSSGLLAIDQLSSIDLVLISINIDHQFIIDRLCISL